MICARMASSLAESRLSRPSLAPSTGPLFLLGSSCGMFGSGAPLSGTLLSRACISRIWSSKDFCFLASASLRFFSSSCFFFSSASLALLFLVLLLLELGLLARFLFFLLLLQPLLLFRLLDLLGLLLLLRLARFLAPAPPRASWPARWRDRAARRRASRRSGPRQARPAWAARPWRLPWVALGLGRLFHHLLGRLGRRLRRLGRGDGRRLGASLREPRQAWASPWPRRPSAWRCARPGAAWSPRDGVTRSTATGSGSATRNSRCD